MYVGYILVGTYRLMYLLVTRSKASVSLVQLLTSILLVNLYIHTLILSLKRLEYLLNQHSL